MLHKEALVYTQHNNYLDESNSAKSIEAKALKAT